VAGSSSSGEAGVTLAGGRRVAARRGVVVAVEGPEAARLLGQQLQVGGVCLHARV
jgi:hypothetical protein